MMINISIHYSVTLNGQLSDNHQDVTVYTVRRCARACVCVGGWGVITHRKCLFMFDWVGPDWTLGTFKQTISTSCLKSLSGGEVIEKKKKKKSSLRWTPGHLCKRLS